MRGRGPVKDRSMSNTQGEEGRSRKIREKRREGLKKIEGQAPYWDEYMTFGGKSLQSGKHSCDNCHEFSTQQFFLVLYNKFIIDVVSHRKHDMGNIRIRHVD